MHEHDQFLFPKKAVKNWHCSKILPIKYFKQIEFKLDLENAASLQRDGPASDSQLGTRIYSCLPKYPNIEILLLNEALTGHLLYLN